MVLKYVFISCFIFTEIEKVCDEQDNVILLKDTAIKDLKTRLQQQKKTHQHQITDQEIHLQQERYLAQNYFTGDSASNTTIKNSKKKKHITQK